MIATARRKGLRLFYAHRLLLPLLLTALSAGCSSMPDRSTERLTGSTEQSSNRESVALQVDGALPFRQQGPGDAAFFTSRANVSIDADWLEYDAEYAFEPGTILSSNGQNGLTKSTPKRFGKQRAGQNVKLKLPIVAGAPLLMGFASKTKNQWAVDGLQATRERSANLRWAPGAAEIALQWKGEGSAYERTSALTCDLQGTLQLPLSGQAGHSRKITLASNRCTVVEQQTAYAGLQAQTWGFGYAWGSPGRESSATLSVIRPEPGTSIERVDLMKSYELGLSHRLDFGPLSASTRVAMRRREFAHIASPLATLDDGLTDAQWVAKTSLKWQQEYASVTASWLQGANPLWFAPEFGRHQDSFGLNLDLSGLLVRQLPYAHPELTMNWKWSETRTARDLTVGGNTLDLRVALLF